MLCYMWQTGSGATRYAQGVQGARLQTVAATLSLWQRAITGDRYVAMKYGPVPSAIYDMVKIVKGEKLCCRRTASILLELKDFVLNLCEMQIWSYLSATGTSNNSIVTEMRLLTLEKEHNCRTALGWQRRGITQRPDDTPLRIYLPESGAETRSPSTLLWRISTHKRRWHNAGDKARRYIPPPLRQLFHPKDKFFGL